MQGRVIIVQQLKDFTAAISKKHKLYKAYYNRALSYLNLNKLNEASRDLNEVIKGEPANADAYLILGVIYSMKKRF